MNKKIIKSAVSILLILSVILSFPLSSYAADDYEAFLNKLGYYESGNRYNITNEFGYLGRWQVGMDGLQDVGFVDSSGNWTALANSFGVYSKQDFLNSPEAQDYAIRLFHKKIWSYIQYLGDDQYIGSEFDGIQVTLSGLIGAAHLVGAGGVHKMFMTGVVTTDALGNKCTFYLKVLANYDLSEFLGADLSKYLNNAIKSKAKIAKIQSAMKTSSTINLYGNTSECNYLLGTDFAGELDESNYYSRDKKTYRLSVDTNNRYSGFNSLKISGAGAGKNGKDVAFKTDTNGNVINDKFIGDYKNMTLSFYAKSSVDGVGLSWRFGYASKPFGQVKISKQWKKYSLTFTKNSTDGSMLYLYFDKAANVNLAQIMLVDGEKTPTLFRCETSKCVKSVKAVYLSSYGKLPTPTRQGYRFDGWFTSKSGGKKVDSSTPAYDKSLNLYAHWTKIPKYIPETATEYNGHFYTVFTDDLSWEQAKKACERMGGHLVVIDDEDENKMLCELCASTSKGLYWIGAYADEKGNWKWVNNRKFDYSEWDVNQPSGGEEKYVQIYAEHVADNDRVGKWNDAVGKSGAMSWYSVKNVGYVCEFDPETLKPVANGKLNDSQYTVFDKQIGWYNANFYCQLNGGNLVSICDEKENKYVSSLLKKTGADAFWTAGTNLTGDGRYLWTTGEKFKYQNWCKNNPTNNDSFNGTDHFMMLEKKTSKFNDVPAIGADAFTTGFVLEVDPNVPKIEKLRISSDERDKLLLFAGDRLDKSAVRVIAQMSDSTYNEINYGYYIHPIDFDSPGIKEVKVEYRGLKTSFKVFVFSSHDAVRVESCEFKNKTVSVIAGHKKSQKIIILPEEAECKYAYWKSSDENIAKVDSDGNVIGVSKGKAVIIATTFDGQYSAEYLVNVKRTFWEWTKYYVFFGWTAKTK